MTTTTVNYGPATALNIGVASLGSSATFVTGRASTQIDNTTDKFLDAMLEGFISVGTTPTVDKTIRIYVWGSHTSLGTTARDALDGTDSAETLTSEGVRDGFLVRAKSLRVDSTTSNRKYEFGPISVAGALGLDTLPQYWGVFVTHNTGANLRSGAGNHEMKYTGIKFDSA